MGSRSTQSTKIPEYIEEAGKLALQRAQEVQAMGYVPYMGPEVATINPYEQAAAANVGGMASAFGMQAPTGLDMGGMPTVTQGGITGYSSYPAYLSAMERLREQRPDQYEYLSGMGRFDPITGAVNPSYNMPVMEGETASNMPVVSPSSGGGNDDAPSHAEIMQMHYGNPNGPSGSSGYNVTTSFGSGSTPKPVLRGESTGGLFSGMREAKNKVLDTLGVI
jgi:hypothetical protein